MEFIFYIACMILGAALFAAGAWFRHNYIKPAPPPAQLPPGKNPWGGGFTYGEEDPRDK